MCGEALGAATKSVLHLQKDRCFKEQKFAAILQHFPVGMMCGGRRVFQPGVFCIYKRPVLEEAKNLRQLFSTSTSYWE
ncbi:MAG: hypothetical protein V8S12_05435 [Lachnospiraceae bacterium]